jgi:hypothetical protein
MFSYDNRRQTATPRRIAKRYDSEAIKAVEALYEIANNQAIGEGLRLDALAQIDAIYKTLSEIQTTKEISVCGVCGKPWDSKHANC